MESRCRSSGVTRAIPRASRPARLSIHVFHCASLLEGAEEETKSSEEGGCFSRELLNGEMTEPRADFSTSMAWLIERSIADLEGFSQARLIKSRARDEGAVFEGLINKRSLRYRR